jgi:Domain of unknown function (DUF3471)
MLGNGDITNSLVALTFYRDFVLAPRYRQPWPVIDWSSDDSTVLDHIKQVQDETVRELLAKEFYSRYMLAKSLAQVQEQAHLLAMKRAQAQEMLKSIDPKTLDAYAGEYKFEEFEFTVRVSRIGDGLYIQQPGEAAQELLPSSKMRFFIIVGIDIFDFEFTFDETNHVTGLIVTEYGQSFTARRK